MIRSSNSTDRRWMIALCMTGLLALIMVLSPTPTRQVQRTTDSTSTANRPINRIKPAANTSPKESDAYMNYHHHEWSTAVATVPASVPYTVWVNAPQGSRRLQPSYSSSILTGYAKKFHKLMSQGPAYGIFVDVGGNIGQCALPVAALGYQVVTFDPVPYNILHILKSREANNWSKSQLNVVQAAVTEKRKGSMTIHVPSDKFGDNASLGDKSANQNVKSDPKERYSVEVPTESVDEYLRDHKYDISHVTLMKLDVQGFEHGVLLGSTQLLREAVCSQRMYFKVMFELSSGLIKNSGQDIAPEASLVLLDSMGYELNDEHNGKAIPKSDFQSYASSAGNADIIAKPKALSETQLKELGCNDQADY